MPALGVLLQPGAATFQAWLFESTGKIEFVYGTGLVTDFNINFNTGGYSVGFNSGATVFASVTTRCANCLLYWSQ